MTPLFADTSYYVALLSPRDQHHESAVNVGTELFRPVVTSEFVLFELANAFAAGESRPDLTEFWGALDADPLVSIVAASSELLHRGLELYADRPDKQWSLTDCTSFLIMDDRRIEEALTADHHFEQAGFRILLI